MGLTIRLQFQIFLASKDGALVSPVCFKARLHRRFLSRQLDAIFVALKLQQVSNMFETPCDIAATNRTEIAPCLHVRF